MFLLHANNIKLLINEYYFPINYMGENLAYINKLNNLLNVLYSKVKELGIDYITNNNIIQSGIHPFRENSYLNPNIEHYYSVLDYINKKYKPECTTFNMEEKVSNMEKYLTIDLITTNNVVEIVCSSGLIYSFQSSDVKKFQKVFRNIVVNKGEILIKSMSKINFHFHNEREYSQSQQNFFDKYDCTVKMHNGIKLRTSEEYIEGSNKLLVTLPGFLLEDVTNFTFYKLTSIKKTKMSTVAFCDDYHCNGTYMLVDDYGNNIIPNIVSYIRKLMLEKKFDKLILFGASKGATIATLLHNYFPDAMLIANVPQYSIWSYLVHQPNLYGTLYQYYEYSKIGYDLDTSNYLSSIIDGNAFVSYSQKDFASSLGIKNSNNNFHEYDKYHSEITEAAKKEWEIFLNKQT